MANSGLEVVCENNDGEIELSVIELVNEGIWIIKYSFDHSEVGKTRYSLQSGISFMKMGDKRFSELFFTVTTPRLKEQKKYVRADLYVNYLKGTSGTLFKCMALERMTMGRAKLVKDDSSSDAGKLFFSVNVSKDSQVGRYEGIMTVMPN